jgi:hypothetical protein
LEATSLIKLARLLSVAATSPAIDVSSSFVKPAAGECDVVEFTIFCRWRQNAQSPVAAVCQCCSAVLTARLAANPAGRIAMALKIPPLRAEILCTRPS